MAVRQGSARLLASAAACAAACFRRFARPTYARCRTRSSPVLANPQFLGPDTRFMTHSRRSLADAAPALGAARLFASVAEPELPAPPPSRYVRHAILDARGGSAGDAFFLRKRHNQGWSCCPRKRRRSLPAWTIFQQQSTGEPAACPRAPSRAASLLGLPAGLDTPMAFHLPPALADLRITCRLWPTRPGLSRKVVPPPSTPAESAPTRRGRDPVGQAWPAAASRSRGPGRMPDHRPARRLGHGRIELSRPRQ